jgi:hypothetical protein
LDDILQSQFITGSDGKSMHGVFLYYEQSINYDFAPLANVLHATSSSWVRKSLAGTLFFAASLGLLE